MESKKRILKIHEKNAKTIIYIEQKLLEFYFQEQTRIGKTKANHLYLLYKKLINVKGYCDDLIQYTNPEAKDNITYYYSKFTKRGNRQ